MSVERASRGGPDLPGSLPIAQDLGRSAGTAAPTIHPSGFPPPRTGWSAGSTSFQTSESPRQRCHSALPEGLRPITVVVDIDLHCRLMAQGLTSQRKCAAPRTLDVDIAVIDPDGLARQPNQSLDVADFRIFRIAKHDDVPAPGGPLPGRDGRSYGNIITRIRSPLKLGSSLSARPDTRQLPHRPE